MPRRGCARLWHEDVDVRPRPSDDAAMGARNRGPSGWPGGRHTDAARLDLTASQALRRATPPWRLPDPTRHAREWGHAL